jgi:hypothetical protein
VNIDADNNSATGNTNGHGIEYVLLAADFGGGLGRWDGSAFQPVEPSSLGMSYSSGVTLTVRAADIGVPESFRFWVGTWDNDDDPANWDAAPGAGFFTYSLTAPAPPPTPTITRILTPATVLLPKPGKMLAARGIQLEINADEVVSPETIECTLKLAGREVTPLAGGCKWRIPKAAAGKRGTLILTLGYQGATVTQRYPLRVGR